MKKEGSKPGRQGKKVPKKNPLRGPRKIKGRGRAFRTRGSKEDGKQHPHFANGWSEPEKRWKEEAAATKKVQKSTPSRAPNEWAE